MYSSLFQDVKQPKKQTVPEFSKGDPLKHISEARIPSPCFPTFYFTKTLDQGLVPLYSLITKATRKQFECHSALS
jgi:hypothetical protein